MNPGARGPLLEFAVDLAFRAGRSTLAHFQNGVEVETKSDASPVTVADRAAESIMRDRIAAVFPADGIVGEEFGTVRDGAARRWILDPIDGTRSFVRGVPLYGTLIGLEEEGQPVLGVIHLPALGESVWAASGLGCWWNGRRARVSATAHITDALIVASDAESFERQGRSAGWNRLRESAGLCRTWGDCYGYALVATGRAEAMIDPILSVWDAAAVVPIVREAGGVVTSLDGDATHDAGSLIATNAALSEEIRRVFEIEP
jgi:histidinol-phosphatase